jgi:hypothetical protein
MHVKSRFQDAMRGEIDAELLVLLEDVFFELTFPTPPIGSFESIDGKGNRQNE